jgi:hypothetical protein
MNSEFRYRSSELGIRGAIRAPCGEAGIRTLDTASGIPVFETGAFNHSATSPGDIQVCVQNSESGARCALRAERVGFEPTIPLRVYYLSRVASSTAPAPLQALPRRKEFAFGRAESPARISRRGLCSMRRRGEGDLTYEIRPQSSRNKEGASGPGRGDVRSPKGEPSSGARSGDGRGGAGRGLA